MGQQARRVQPPRRRTVEEPDRARIEAIVELLCRAEAGRRVELESVPRSTLEWFLASAERFRPVAYAAVALLGRVSSVRDEALRAAVARAAASFLDLLPERVEALLFALARSGGPEVQRAAQEVLGSRLPRGTA